jgi:hypothetical protein
MYQWYGVNLKSKIPNPKLFDEPISSSRFKSIFHGVDSYYFMEDDLTVIIGGSFSQEV